MKLLNKELIEKAQRYNLSKPATIVAKKDEDVYDMFLYDVIGSDTFGGIGARQVADELKNVPEGATLNVRINSPGGDVFDGLAIYNLLSQKKGKKIMFVDGLAASIASVIAMGGDEVVMASESEMMIHEAWTMTAGNAKELRDLADRLETSNSNISAIYQRKTGQPADKIAEMMAAETWMTPAMAVELKFADSIVTPVACDPGMPKPKKMRAMTPIEIMRLRAKR